MVTVFSVNMPPGKHIIAQQHCPQSYGEVVDLAGGLMASSTACLV
jgi:hypothetical protein